MENYSENIEMEGKTERTLLVLLASSPPASLQKWKPQTMPEVATQGSKVT